MPQNSWRISALVLLALGASLYARTRRPESQMNAVKGVRIASRRPCDGATNPSEEIHLLTTFSPGGWERTFHLDEFEGRYCRYVDLYFFCLKHGRNGWRNDWTASSTRAPVTSRYWLSACTALESNSVPEYLLSGWYKEGAGGKLPWKQAILKRVSSNPEVYEFTDPHGGTARVEIARR